jgi:hypothetical protein
MENEDTKLQQQQNRNRMLQIIIRLLLRYILEGLIIAMVAYYIPILYKTSLKTPTVNEIFSIGLTASLTMMILDFFSQKTGIGLRLGAGFGIGKGLVNL